MDSLLRLASYLIILLVIWATPSDRYQNNLAAIVLCAVNVVGTLPWVIAEMTRSRAKWPEIVSSMVMLLTAIAAALLLYKQKKKKDSDENGKQSS